MKASVLHIFLGVEKGKLPNTQSLYAFWYLSKAHMKFSQFDAKLSCELKVI
jgi:hypothetical protein